MTWRDVLKSQPSTSWTYNPGNPLTSFEIEPPAMPTSTGTQIAEPLSSTRDTTGSFRFVAVFNDSQNSPSLVVPSPVVTSTTSSFSKPSVIPSSLALITASAEPTACKNCVPVGEETDTMFRSFFPQ